MLDLTPCPEPDCPAPATLSDRTAIESTDGPVEHVRVTCAAGHRFYCPVEMLVGSTLPAPEEYVLSVGGRYCTAETAVADWRAGIAASGLEPVGCPVARDMTYPRGGSPAFRVHGHARRSA